MSDAAAPGPFPGGHLFPHEELRAPTTRPLSVYVHIPFCAVRCGYCDFNTSTPSQLAGMNMDDYLAAVHAEIAAAARALGTGRAVSTVFFGGGTPTMATPAQLGEVLADLRDTFGLVPGAEVTTEANPETLDRARLETLLGSGFNRLSLGMQSADEQVLARLDRHHTPGRALQVARWAHEVGFPDVSLDLIYGTPGESLDSWRATLDAALGVAPEHLSAYSLIVEEGTALARRIRHGELAMPDEDAEADEYLLAERMLSTAGLANYEISNWALPGHEARHNLAYWRSDDWWGFGPGAHSHVHGVRWWNVRHPRRYAALLGEGARPREDFEVIDAPTRHEERVLLELRIADGLPVGELTGTERARLAEPLSRGLVTVVGDRVHLTLQGRLLADAVTRDLLD